MDAAGGRAAALSEGTPKPGRISTSPRGVNYQDEAEFGPMCTDRAANGYNSGMGEIFRKVASISPVQIRRSDTPQLAAGPPPPPAVADAEATPAAVPSDLAAFEVNARGIPTSVPSRVG